jgi:hypothetical protein
MTNGVGITVTQATGTTPSSKSDYRRLYRIVGSYRHISYDNCRRAGFDRPAAVICQKG